MRHSWLDKVDAKLQKIQLRKVKTALKKKLNKKKKERINEVKKITELKTNK